MATLQVTPTKSVFIDARGITRIASDSLELLITVTSRTETTSTFRFSNFVDFTLAKNALESEILEYQRTLDAKVSEAMTIAAKDSLNALAVNFESRLNNILSSITKEYDELCDTNNKYSSLVDDFGKSTDALKWTRAKSTKEDFGKLQEVITSLAGILKE